MSAILAGSTGLVGSHMLTTLTSHSKFTNVSAFSRRKLPVESTKLNTIESPDTDAWLTQFPSGGSIFLSGLGTTRAQAGSIENQRKVDIDLNLALAKAAKEAGVQVYVLISSAGANVSSMMWYAKMKGEIEEGVKQLGFKHTVFLRPGLICGERQNGGLAENFLKQVANFSGRMSGGALKDVWAQDADVIAKAAVNAGIQCLDGKREPGVWTLGQSDIVRLGKTEWAEEKPAGA